MGFLLSFAWEGAFLSFVWKTLPWFTWAKLPLFVWVGPIGREGEGGAVPVVLPLLLCC